MPEVDTEDLKAQLKGLIVETLRMEEIRPEEIKDEEPLFGEGLGLDSVDALELVVAIEKKYGIEIEDEEVGRTAFASISALAGFIRSKRGAGG
jgi:acyl carrier protein